MRTSNAPACVSYRDGADVMFILARVKCDVLDCKALRQVAALNDFEGNATDWEAEFDMTCDAREITGDRSGDACLQWRVIVEPEKSRFCPNQAGFPASTWRSATEGAHAVLGSQNSNVRAQA